MTHEVYFIVRSGRNEWYVHETGWRELCALQAQYPKASVAIMNRHTHEKYYDATINDMTGREQHKLNNTQRGKAWLLHEEIGAMS